MIVAGAVRACRVRAIAVPRVVRRDELELLDDVLEPYGFRAIRARRHHNSPSADWHPVRLVAAGAGNGAALGENPRQLSTNCVQSGNVPFVLIGRTAVIELS